MVDRIPATTVARTLLDLAGTAADRELEKAVSRAERLGHGRDELVSDLATRGPRRGVRRLHDLLEDPSAAAFTRSRAEDRLLALIRRATLPLPVTNVRIGGYEVDCLWPDRGVAVEVDGFAYHRSRRSFEADRRRDLDLASRGIRVVRITWRQLVDEPEALLVRLTRTLLHAGPGDTHTVRRSRSR